MNLPQLWNSRPRLRCRDASVSEPQRRAEEVSIPETDWLWKINPKGTEPSQVPQWGKLSHLPGGGVGGGEQKIKGVLTWLFLLARKWIIHPCVEIWGVGNKYCLPHNRVSMPEWCFSQNNLHTLLGKKSTPSALQVVCKKKFGEWLLLSFKPVGISLCLQV